MKINELIKRYDEKLKAEGISKYDQKGKQTLLLKYIVSMFNKEINSEEYKVKMIDDYINQGII